MYRQSDSTAYEELANAVCQAHLKSFGYSTGEPLEDLASITHHMNWTQELVNRQCKVAQDSINETFSIMNGLASALEKEKA